MACLKYGGLNYQEIGKRFNLTHQRVHQLIGKYFATIHEESKTLCVKCGKEIGYIKKTKSTKVPKFCSRECAIDNKLKFSRDSCCKCGSKDRLQITATNKKSMRYKCRKCSTEKSKKYRNPNLSKKHYLISIKRFPKKYKARLKVRLAIISGKLVKPKNCSICGKETIIHGHHPDYSKPLNITWVCAGCHADIHRKLKKQK